MRPLVQGSVHVTPVVRNAKFLLIVGRKVESVYFPHTMTPEEVKAALVARLEATPDDRVVRG